MCLCCVCLCCVCRDSILQETAVITSLWGVSIPQPVGNKIDKYIIRRVLVLNEIENGFKSMTKKSRQYINNIIKDGQWYNDEFVKLYNDKAERHSNLMNLLEYCENVLDIPKSQSQRTIIDSQMWDAKENIPIIETAGTNVLINDLSTKKVWLVTGLTYYINDDIAHCHTLDKLCRGIKWWVNNSEFKAMQLRLAQNKQSQVNNKSKQCRIESEQTRVNAKHLQYVKGSKDWTGTKQERKEYLSNNIWSMADCDSLAKQVEIHKINQSYYFPKLGCEVLFSTQDTIETGVLRWKWFEKRYNLHHLKAIQEKEKADKKQKKQKQNENNSNNNTDDIPMTNDDTETFPDYPLGGGFIHNKYHPRIEIANQDIMDKWDTIGAIQSMIDYIAQTGDFTLQLWRPFNAKYVSHYNPAMLASHNDPNPIFGPVFIFKVEYGCKLAVNQIGGGSAIQKFAAMAYTPGGCTLTFSEYSWVRAKQNTHNIRRQDTCVERPISLMARYANMQQLCVSALQTLWQGLFDNYMKQDTYWYLLYYTAIASERTKIEELAKQHIPILHKSTAFGDTMDKIPANLDLCLNTQNTHILLKYTYDVLQYYVQWCLYSIRNKNEMVQHIKIVKLGNLNENSSVSTCDNISSFLKSKNKHQIKQFVQALRSKHAFAKMPKISGVTKL